jgi:hypothetical protein
MAFLRLALLVALCASKKQHPGRNKKHTPESRTAPPFPQFTRDGAVATRAKKSPRYDADKCFKRAGTMRHITSPNRGDWIHPPRHPSATYAWTPAASASAGESCFTRKGSGRTIDVPSATAMRQALRNHTIVVAGDSIALQTYLSLSALLVCGDGDAVRVGDHSAIVLPEHGVTLRFVDARFGVAVAQTTKSGEDAWFIDSKGKKRAIRSSGRVEHVRPWGSRGEKPRAAEGVVAALREFEDRDQVTYVFNYGHWLSHRRSDVRFYAQDDAPVSDGAGIYAQTHAVLAKELVKGMRASHRAVFLGYSPKPGDGPSSICRGSERMSRAARQGLAAYPPDKGIFFLDMACPLVRAPKSAYARKSDHWFLPGAPDLSNAILTRFIECASSSDPGRRRRPHTGTLGRTFGGRPGA